ncbi:MAG: hypothetical protein DMG22_17950 [Acidobacteria bacterium]|nr:MAG: hypothetical protein DMG22_17950 [Acidobacteriota bacterium]
MGSSCFVPQIFYCCGAGIPSPATAGSGQALPARLLGRDVPATAAGSDFWTPMESIGLQLSETAALPHRVAVFYKAQ